MLDVRHQFKIYVYVTSITFVYVTINLKFARIYKKLCHNKYLQYNGLRK